MRSITAACTELVDKLKAAGFTSAGLDPEQIAPPGAVWVQPREVRDYRLDGGATLVAWCYLIVTGDTEQAMARLDDALDGFLPLVDLAATDDVIDLAAAIVLPANPSAPLPAYRVAVDLDL